MSFNKFIGEGNLTKDIELKYAQSGTAIANTGLAMNRKFTSNGEKREEVCFVDITFFGRQAEIANQYLRKGSNILIEGRLKLDNWVDQNGQKRSKHSIIVETMQMLGTKDGAAQGEQPAQQQNNAPAQQQSYQQPAQQQQNNAPQQQSYQQPAQQQQNNAPQQQQQQQSYQQPAQQQQNNAPTIDIDEDEIPF